MKTEIIILRCCAISISLFVCKDLLANNIVCEDKQIEGIVQRLNEENSELKQDMRKLSSNPYHAMGCLIKELHPIEEIEIIHTEFDKHKSTMHVVWCIRTLRYLTGLDFRSRSNYKFKRNEKNRKYLLSNGRKEKLSFFAVWMSRDIIYFAPQDTQMDIIEKWEKWYSTDAKSFNYKQDEDINNWYF